MRKRIFLAIEKSHHIYAINKNRKHNRLRNYDYSSPGVYYVTICSQNRKYLFGEIKNRKMILNKYGRIVQDYWQEIPNHYPNVKLDQWIIMPNHIHGIITILDNGRPVGTEHCSVPTVTTNTANPMKPVSVSQIVKSFKDITTKRIRSKSADIYFIWQRSFYDHIVRDEITLNKIREYITNNPVQWATDEENKPCAFR